VVLVEDDGVPLDEVNDLVVLLDLPVRGLAAHVLKRREPHHRIRGVRGGVAVLR